MIKKPKPQHLHICIDEAGRGPLAGPVCVGMVMSLAGFERSQYRDSKQLTEQQREKLLLDIYQLEDRGKLVSGRGMATAAEIDQQGIITSLQLATCRGLFALLKKFYLQTRRPKLLTSTFGEDTLALLHLDRQFRKYKVTPDVIEQIIGTANNYYRITQLILDGNHTFHLDKTLTCSIQTIVKGDQKNPLISMASIIAKVTRDTWMVKASRHAPVYNLDQHKGYGTIAHRKAIKKHGLSPLHRVSFCHNITTKRSKSKLPKSYSKIPKLTQNPQLITHNGLSIGTAKPKLLLHICCAPDLTRPLHRLKQHFHLQLFWYNPNIHPRKEHSKRYDQFIKLIGLEKGEYDILEDRYDPKEFFQAMFDERTSIKKNLQDADKVKTLKVAGDMEERSSRCNPCYSMRLAQAAKIAAKNHIPYFTSTLLISPKKKMDKLYRWGLEGEKRNPSTKFLRFDFAKDGGYHKASILTKKHGLFRQNYCGCGWTIPKKGEVIKEYRGG